jgi:uncharacterized protein YbcI
MKTRKSDIEVRLREFIIKFEKEYMGRGPEDTKVYIIEDLIIIRLKGVLTIAETQLSKTKEGQALVKKTRLSLLETLRGTLDSEIKKITGMNVSSFHTDISTVTGERIIVFTLMENLGKMFD